MNRRQARVLSLGELRQTWDYVWIERRYLYGREDRLIRGMLRWFLSAILQFDTKNKDGILMRVGEYGVTMRCWTVQPTIDEMNQTKWI